MQIKDATILIADDELDLREILGAWFRREGARVLVAKNGAEALKVIQANRVDVVVSDVRMPVMDGISLLKEHQGRWPIQFQRDVSQRLHRH